MYPILNSDIAYLKSIHKAILYNVCSITFYIKYIWKVVADVQFVMMMVFVALTGPVFVSKMFHFIISYVVNQCLTFFTLSFLPISCKGMKETI